MFYLIFGLTILGTTFGACFHHPDLGMAFGLGIGLTIIGVLVSSNGKVI